MALPVLGFGSIVTTYCKVAVSVMADRRLRGDDSTVSDGMSVATAKLNRIVSWTMVSIAVGLLLQVIAERFRLAGTLVSNLLGMAWNLGTMFVIPVIALEDLSGEGVDTPVCIDLQVEVGRVGRRTRHGRARGHVRGDPCGASSWLCSPRSRLRSPITAAVRVVRRH